MSKIVLDLKNFKHVKSDDGSTTLQHEKEEHQITLSHKHLPKEAQEQLKALAKASVKEEPQEIVEESADEPVQMAEGGPVSELDEALKFDPTKPALPTPDEKYATKFKELKQTFPNQPDEVIDRTVLKDLGQEVDKQNQNAQEAQAFHQEQSVPDTAAVDANNAKRVKAGLTPVENSASMVQPEASQGLDQQSIPIEQPKPVSSPSPEVPGLAGMGNQIAGINQQAKALGELGEQQAKKYEEQVIADKQALAEYQKTYQEIEAENKALVDDIRASHVSPDKYWTGDANGNGGHSKIAAGIGMILAGFNPSGKPNAAIDFLKTQMEQSLQAQARNLGSKETLLSYNMQKFGNLKSAFEATRIQQNDILTNELQQQAAKAQTPLAKAAALQAIGKLQQENAVKMQDFSKKVATQNLVDLARNDPSKIPAALRALEYTNPERAKEMRALTVPGLGFANDLEGAKGLREMQTTVKTVNDGIKRLHEILNTGGKSLSPTLRSEAQSIRAAMIGRLRVPMLGPGTMNEGEAARLMSIIPDPTELFSYDPRTKTKLDTLSKGVQSNYRNQAIANGINLPKEAGQSPQEQAREWLLRNPNDPRAAKIKQSLGIK